MPVPVQDRPPRRDAVDDFASVRKVQKFILRANASERLIRAQERCVWMPNGSSIFRKNLFELRTVWSRVHEKGMQAVQLLALLFRTGAESRRRPSVRRPKRNHHRQTRPCFATCSSVNGSRGPSRTTANGSTPSARRAARLCNVLPMPPNFVDETSRQGLPSARMSSSCNSVSFSGENGPPKVSIRIARFGCGKGLRAAISCAVGIFRDSRRAASGGATGVCNRQTGGWMTADGIASATRAESGSPVSTGFQYANCFPKRCSHSSANVVLPASVSVPRITKSLI